MSRRTRKNVGVIGLGIIGNRVREVLRRKGFHVFVWNRTPRPIPNFVGAPAELAEMCDFIQIFVSDDDALLYVVKQLGPALAAHHVVMAHSTVAPHTMVAAAEIVERRHARFVEAPFTGSKEAAEKGELVYYLGGAEDAINDARPILEATSKQILEIGAVGQATAIKLATNMVTAASIQAAAEALALVQSAGLPPEKFAAAMKNNASNSTTLNMKLSKMIHGNFEPHFSVKHMLKDLQIANRLGLTHHLELGVASASRDRLLEQMQSGHGDEDYSVVIRKYFPDIIPAGSETNGLELFDAQRPAASPEMAEPSAHENEHSGFGEISHARAEEIPGPIDIFGGQMIAAPVLAPHAQLEAGPEEEEEIIAAESETMFSEEEEPLPEEAEQHRGFLSRLLRR